MRVVVEFAAHFLGRPRGLGHHRHGEKALQQRAAGIVAQRFFQIALHRLHVDVVVMQRMQCRGGRRRYPRRVGAGLRMRDLLLEHRRHQVGHRPHALADLRAAAQPRAQAHPHVALLIGVDPRRRFHVALAQHRARFHRRMHLVAGAVEKARVDERHARRRRRDAGREVDAGAPLLVHDAHLHRVPRKAEQVFHAREQLVGERHFLRPVHLGLDDVDRTRARIHPERKIVHRGEGRDHRVQDALGDLVPFAIENRRAGHQVADVADEHQRATRQRERRAVAGRVRAVRMQATGERLPALGYFLGQIALHEAQPVAIDARPCRRRRRRRPSLRNP